MRYAQITDEGYVVSDSYLSGEVDYPNMIPIPEDFDLTNKRYVVSAKYSCGFSNLLDSSIIVNER